MLSRSALIVATMLVTSSAVPAAAQQGRALPFTQEEDADGARYVWFIIGEAGLPYTYVPAREFPKSASWGEVPRSQRRGGDVAWWPDFVAIYGPDKSGVDLLTAPGMRRLSSEEERRGPAKFYRLKVPSRTGPRR